MPGPGQVNRGDACVARVDPPDAQNATSGRSPIGARNEPLVGNLDIIGTIDPSGDADRDLVDRIGREGGERR